MAVRGGRPGAPGPCCPNPGQTVNKPPRRPARPVLPREQAKPAHMTPLRVIESDISPQPGRRLEVEMTSAAPPYFCGLARMLLSVPPQVLRAPGESPGCPPVLTSAGPSRPRIGLGGLLRWIHAVRAAGGTGARARCWMQPGIGVAARCSLSASRGRASRRCWRRRGRKLAAWRRSRPRGLSRSRGCRTRRSTSSSGPRWACLSGSRERRRRRWRARSGCVRARPRICTVFRLRCSRCSRRRPRRGRCSASSTTRSGSTTTRGRRWCSLRGGCTPRERRCCSLRVRVSSSRACCPSCACGRWASWRCGSCWPTVRAQR